MPRGLKECWESKPTNLTWISRVMSLPNIETLSALLALKVEVFSTIAKSRQLLYWRHFCCLNEVSTPLENKTTHATDFLMQHCKSSYRVGCFVFFKHNYNVLDGGTPHWDQSTVSNYNIPWTQWIQHNDKPYTMSGAHMY